MSDFPTKILYIKTTMTELNKLIEKLINDVNITNESLKISIDLIEKIKSEINITTIQIKKNELQDKIILELKKCIGIGPNSEELLYQKLTLSKELKIHSLNHTKIKEVIEKIKKINKNLELEFKTFENNQINLLINLAQVLKNQ
jgi:ribosomal protein S13